MSTVQLQDAVIRNYLGVDDSGQGAVTAVTQGAGITVTGLQGGVQQITNSGLLQIQALPATGVTVAGTQSAPTLANDGVLSIVAGAGVNVTGATGVVTISEVSNSVVSYLVAPSVAQVNYPITFNNLLTLAYTGAPYATVAGENYAISVKGYFIMTGGGTFPSNARVTIEVSESVTNQIVGQSIIFDGSSPLATYTGAIPFVFTGIIKGGGGDIVITALWDLQGTVGAGTLNFTPQSISIYRIS